MVVVLVVSSNHNDNAYNDDASTEELSGRCIFHDQIDKNSAQAVLFAEATVSF